MLETIGIILSVAWLLAMVANVSGIWEAVAWFGLGGAAVLFLARWLVSDIDT